MNVIPQRVNAAYLAKLWSLTSARVSQLAKQGRIKKGPDGLFDLQEAMAFRQAMVGRSEQQAFFKPYGTKAGVKPPKALEHIVDRETFLSADDVLGLTPAPAPAPDASVAPAQNAKAADMVERYGEIQRLKVEAERLKLEKQRRLDAQARGALISALDVTRAARSAGAELKTMLHSLEYEIAALFPDAMVKEEVHGKVSRTIERALFAMHKKFEKFVFDGEGDDDPLS